MQTHGTALCPHGRQEDQAPVISQPPYHLPSPGLLQQSVTEAFRPSYPLTLRRVQWRPSPYPRIQEQARPVVVLWVLAMGGLILRILLAPWSLSALAAIWIRGLAPQQPLLHHSAVEMVPNDVLLLLSPWSPRHLNYNLPWLHHHLSIPSIHLLSSIHGV